MHVRAVGRRLRGHRAQVGDDGVRVPVFTTELVGLSMWRWRLRISPPRPNGRATFALTGTHLACLSAAGRVGGDKCDGTATAVPSRSRAWLRERQRGEVRRKARLLRPGSGAHGQGCAGAPPGLLTTRGATTAPARVMARGGASPDLQRFRRGLVAQASHSALPATRKARSAHCTKPATAAARHRTKPPVTSRCLRPAGGGDGAGRVRRQHPLGVRTELLEDRLGEAVPRRCPRLVPWWALAGAVRARQRQQPRARSPAQVREPTWSVMTVSVPASA